MCCMNSDLGQRSVLTAFLVMDKVIYISQRLKVKEFNRNITLMPVK